MPTNKPIISLGERPHHSVYNPQFRGAGAACRPLRRATKGRAFGNRKPLKRLDLNFKKQKVKSSLFDKHRFNGACGL